MVSFKRFLHIILIIVGVGGIFLIYNIHESQPASVQSLTGPALEREFMEERQVDKGDVPQVWILGDPEDERCGEIYKNVRQELLCKGWSHHLIHMTAVHLWQNGTLQLYERR